MNFFIQRSARFRFPFTALLAFALIGTVRVVNAQNSPPIRIEVEDIGNGYYDTWAKAPVSVGTPWIWERALHLGRARDWAPVAAGQGDFVHPLYDQRVRIGSSGGWIMAECLARRIPAEPVAPPQPGEVGDMPGGNYLFVHAGMTHYASGYVAARWRATDTALAEPRPMRTALFTPAELNLYPPAGPARQPFGLGFIVGPGAGTATVPLPVAGSFIIFPQPTPEAYPPQSSFTGTDVSVRAFFMENAAAMRAELWPPVSQGPPPPPTPVTLAQRAFYRLRPADALSPGNTHGVPEGLASAFGAGGRLILSEVCFLRYARLDGGEEEIVGGEAADFVEIYNPTPHTLSTAGYFLTDDDDEPEKFALPVESLGPGDSMIIHCTGQGKSRMSPADALYDRTAPFGLSEGGEEVFLVYPQEEPLETYIDSLFPPLSGVFPTHAHARVSFGRQARGTGGGASVVTGWFEYPTPGAVNSGWVCDAALPEPLVENADFPPETPVPLPGQVFESGVILVRLRCLDNAAAIVYTLNGTEPDGGSHIYDPEKPIEITGTAVLSARALRAGKLPSSVITRSFLHLPTVPLMKTPEANGIPLCEPMAMANYAETAPPRAGFAAAPGGLTGQLKCRPIVALRWDPRLEGVEMVDSGNGPEWRVSFEYIDPSNPAAYSQENGTARILGNHSGNTPPSIQRFQRKASLHVLFKKAFNLRGASQWNGGQGANGKSAVFPGSLATKFSRVQLRGGHSDSWTDPSPHISDALYFKDSYLKETQRDLGGLTAHRRFVHLFVNGLFWGLYDLGEHAGPDMIAEQLNAGLPVEDRTITPEQVLFYNASNADEIDPAAKVEWDAVITAASQARALLDAHPVISPAEQMAWEEVTSLLSINDYIDFIICLVVTGNNDHKENEIRAWKYIGVGPTAGKFHMIAWDGDGTLFEIDNYDLLAPDFPFSPTDDLLPHAHLKFHPLYRAAFDARLDLHMATGGPLTQAKIQARFNARAADVRRSLECEAMRWSGNGFLDENTGDYVSSMEENLTSWAGNLDFFAPRVSTTQADLVLKAQAGGFYSE